MVLSAETSYSWVRPDNDYCADGFCEGNLTINGSLSVAGALVNFTFVDMNVSNLTVEWLTVNEHADIEESNVSQCLDVLGQMALGEDRLCRDDIAIHVYESSSSNSQSQYGIHSTADYTGAANTAQTYYGLNAVAHHSSAATNTDALRGLVGGRYVARNYGSGTVNHAMGIAAGGGEIRSSGDITNAYGIRYECSADYSTGSIINNYGAYFDDCTVGTNDWAIYSQAGTVYHQGYVGLGSDDTPIWPLSITRGAPERAESNYYGSALMRSTTTDTANSVVGLYTSAERDTASNINEITTGLNSFAYWRGTGDNSHTEGGLSGGTYGAYLDSTATLTSAIGLKTFVALTNGNAGTYTNAYNLYLRANDAEDGTIENNYGIYVNDGISDNGAITNNYGIYLEDIDEGTNTNYAIYSEGGDVYFGGDVGIGDTTPDYDLDVVGYIYATQDIIADSDLEANDNVYIENFLITECDSQLIPDDAVPLIPATINYDIQSSCVEFDCQDADGCDITILEAGSKPGAVVNILCESTNACNIYDSMEVTELAGNWLGGGNDTLSLIYLNTKYIELSRSVN